MSVCLCLSFTLSFSALASHHMSHEIARFCGTKGTIYWWTKVEIGFCPASSIKPSSRPLTLSLSGFAMLLASIAVKGQPIKDTDCPFIQGYICYVIWYKTDISYSAKKLSTYIEFRQVFYEEKFLRSYDRLQKLEFMFSSG